MNEPPSETSHKVASGPARWIWLILGFISLALAAIGYLFPIIPGTPFTLVAAACFARSSPKFHHWLRTHPQVGSTVRNWEDHRAMSPRAKVVAVPMILITFGGSIYATREYPYLVLLLGAICIGLIGFLWQLPHPPDEEVSAEPET